MKNKLLGLTLYSALFIGQTCLAAVYVPPNADNPGSLHFDNVQVDTSGNTGAILTATDNGRIHGGQVYELELNNLPAASGVSDATYSSLSQKIESHNITETLNVDHDVTLLLTNFNRTTTGTVQFTITELESHAFSDSGQLLEESIFLQGPKGETGAQGPVGPRGLTGLQGVQGAVGAPGPQGESGSTGVQGPAGPIGLMGFTGPQGAQGNPGSQGPQGDIGPQGPAGTSITDGTTSGDVLTWDGGNWVASQPVDQVAGQDKMQPFNTVNYIIALQGVYPSRNSIHDPTMGEITMFAGNFAPRLWAFCDGQLLAISSNSALYSLLGTTYGGNGVTTFALPDLRGRVPVHAGTGPGLTPRGLGDIGGSERH